MRNGWAFVVHLDPHAEAVGARGHRDRLGRIAVDERIADQVRKHLLEAVAIPRAAQLGALQLNRRGGMRRSQLTDDRCERFAQIHRREDELQATPETTAGEIEDLLDHAGHATRAGA